MAISEDEKWLMAITQAQNIAALLDGELSDVYVKNSNGKETRRIVIEFTEKQNDE